MVDTNARKILILANDANYTYNLRRELIHDLLDSGYEVTLCFPNGPEVAYFQQIGCYFEPVIFKGRSINIVSDLIMLNQYRRILKRIKPDVVLTYTIKPNIYGGMACKWLRIPNIANITGLGSALEKNGFLQQIGVMLYKLATSSQTVYFFQNSENQAFFTRKQIKGQQEKLIPGSGVNLDHFQYQEFPQGPTTDFCYIARIMKEKGIDIYLDAAKTVQSIYPQARFHVAGRCNPEYQEKIDLLSKQGLIQYHGEVHDVRTLFENMQCMVHPSYYPEGLSNILLESAASGRAVITTNRSGCREVVIDQVTGYLVNLQDSADLASKMVKFLNLSIPERIKMGKAGREHVSKNFNRSHVVRTYLDMIKELTQ